MSACTPPTPTSIGGVPLTFGLQGTLDCSANAVVSGDTTGAPAVSKCKVDFFILLHHLGNNQQDVNIPFCGTFLHNRPGLLYQFTADIDISSVTFDTCNNANYDSKIAVFQVRSTLLANTRVPLCAGKQVALYIGLPSLLGSE